ncbi:MAG: ubiquinone biosynthesis regulatory protein kinase UbiB [Xanthomonadales bacterium]|nr:ubiquinone biosynthesis regulatory protein kinase UbiB [Xanthomonadales bacterium]
MIPFRQFGRLLGISMVLARYRLDAILEATHLFRPVRLIRFFAPWGRKGVKDEPRGRRIRLALDDLGPIFVKMGQVLSTRRDLLPPDIADELALLRDQVAPFPSDQAKARVEQALGLPVTEAFAAFDDKPLASASVAQVHGARLVSGEDVVVKVLRPGIEERIDRDLELIRTIAEMADRYWSIADKIRPLEIAAELDKTIRNELDLQREAANASQLKRNFEESHELKIPRIHWDYCKRDVMVMERVSGIPIDDIDALGAAGVDFKRLAERGIAIFYTQVFRDNFFHADMHPGNILVDVSDPADPTYIAMDFGIVGTMPPEHLYYLAENFLAFFEQDYHRVAALHIESGWIPSDVRIDDLESAIRAVCEPQFARSLSEISFAEVLFQLFEVARRFQLIVQPELILLQKTLLNIEGIGRHVYPELDIWNTAQPIMEKIIRERHGVDAAARDLRKRLPSWMEKTPEVPGLVYEYLKQATTGRMETRLSNPSLDQIAHRIESSGRRTVMAVFAVGLVISASLLWALEAPGPRVADVPVLTWAVTLMACWTAWRALRR